MEDKPSQSESKVESLGPIKLNLVKLSDKVQIPKDHQMIEHNEKRVPLPIGQFSPIKSRNPPIMIEEFKE